MGLIDVFYPKLCVRCKREGEYICRDCQKKLIKPEQICPMCCKPSLDGWTHPRCREHEGMERLIVGLPYRGLVQDCLKKVKYKSAWDVIEFLFRLQKLDFRLQECIVTSVPMWSEKEKTRGFNQAEILAQLLAKQYNERIFALLMRIRETKPMFGLDRKKRKLNIEGAFAICKQHTANDIRQNTVILVDDVWTTGSTMRECARILKKSGIKEVWGITLAR